MSVFHVTLMIWAVPWIAPDTVQHTSTPASSEHETGQLHFVESHFDSTEGECSDSEDSVIVIDSEKSSDGEESSDCEDFLLVIPLSNGSYAEVDENTYAKEMVLQRYPAMTDLLSKPYPDVDSSGCILENQNGQEEADAVNSTTNRLGKEQIDDSGDLPEESPTMDKKTEMSYIWAHTGISSYGHRNALFYSQSSGTPVCLIKVTHEYDIVRLRASCLGSFEKWNNVKKIPLRTITEEAADIWAEPSAKIIELIEQFKNETAFYAEMMSLWRKNTSAFDERKFESTQISKLATIYSEMHPESTYSHVHTHYYLPTKYYFGVHI